MVCILIEMYTGELFYETREDVEHIAMIEKQCGPIPFHMVASSPEDVEQLFMSKTQTYKGYEMKLEWPQVSRSRSSVT